jgi:primosomal protein N' (replication factor Y)
LSNLQLNIEAPEGSNTLYADIALPVKVPMLYTYRVPEEIREAISPGVRVIVQFGKKRVITGIVEKLHHTPPEVYVAKPILELLDTTPIVTEPQMTTMRWMAQYYMCTLGEVINAALPSGLKLSSESRIQLHPDHLWHESEYPFDDRELIILKALDHNDSLTYREAAELISMKSAYRFIKSLVQKEVIIIYEELREKYKPKRVKKIRLSEQYAQSEEQLELLFAQLEKRPKQSDIVLRYMQEVPIYHSPEKNEAGIPKNHISEAGLSTGSLRTLIKNGIFTEFEQIVSRFSDIDPGSKEITLSPVQEQAQNDILAHFEDKNTVLLHGITGSGKTEIYISLIQAAMENGDQVLYLLPEIALTAQIVTRLKAVFGDQMGVYHSKFSDNERVEVWQGLLDGRFSFIIGVRSAVFLPFNDLGLIIIDEEHENSYKQYEPAPRYNARDTALYLAHIHGARTILGSATPSIESYANARSDKYGLVTLSERYGGSQLPEMITADVRVERKRKTIVGHFSSVLVEALKQALDKKEQAIIFQNRRGYSNYITCEDCGYIPECPHCAVSLTYHQYKNQLNCHYCGHKEPVPVVCPACGSTRVRTVGMGTEKIEEDLQLIFPDARIQRMDLETTRTKYAYQNIIQSFEKGEVDILVGTQMVSKGLDFDKVSVVGVFDTDRMIHFPDFRSIERTYQMVTQVSGRAGRREVPGKVILQTGNPEQPIIKLILEQDFETFFQMEMQERENYRYPPFTRMIKILIRSKDRQLTARAADSLTNILREDLGPSRILGPQEPVINKIRDKYLMEIFLKVEKKYKTEAVKEVIAKAYLELLKTKEYGPVDFIYDVDPY